MLLSQYLAITQSLIQSPQSPIPLITPALLTTYINIARSQVATDGECVRTSGTGTVAAGVAVQPLAQLALSSNAVAQPLVSRNAYLVGVRVDIRPWDWFVAYQLNHPATATPVMSHQGQGTFADIYISSLAGGGLWVDVVGVPAALVDDTTPDALPFPWTDAVPFYAAYYAYMSFQRQADADMFMMRYRDLMRRARGESTSTMLPENDPGGMGAMIAAAKMALGQPPPQPARGGGRLG
jgi:hypothetical protein